MTNDEQGAEPAVTALEYASPRTEKPSRSVYLSAIALGLAPMVLGGLALLTFWAMRWGWGADHTLLLVVISVALVAAATTQLLLFGFREWRYRRLSPGRLHVRFYLAVLLLLCNVPVLALYTAAPRNLVRRTTITVINNGPATIDRFVVKTTGINTDIGPVAPGATVVRTFDVPMTAWLSYEAWQTRGNSRSMSGGSLRRAADHTIRFSNAGISFK